MDYTLETFSLHFDAINLSDANLVLQWANYRAEVPIKLNEHETQTDLPLALSYIRIVTQSDSALFFQVYREALILKDLNRKEEAIAAARRSKELSQKAGNNDLARLSQRIISELSE